MRLEEVTAEIRPRSDWEAVDLGFAMSRRAFWRCLSVWWLAVLAPTVLGVFLLWDHPYFFVMLFWWWRPAGARMVLFELSRRLFGEAPTWKQVWREIPRAWWRRFFHRFLLARLSPWAPVTMPVEDLEGLRGKAYQQRSHLVMRRGESAVFRLCVGGFLVSLWLTLALLGMVQMLLPEGQSAVFDEAWDAIESGSVDAIPLMASWLLVGCYMFALSLTDLFVTGGGFGIYVNSRTWIEGWDVELAFKRLANRIGTLATLLIASLGLLLQAPVAAAETTPDKVIQEVKAHPDFVIQKTKVPVPDVSKSSGSSSVPDWLVTLMAGFGNVLLVVCALAVVAFIGWLLWIFRHLLRDRGGFDGGPGSAARARVVMGMEVTPESLPENVPETAWRWWNEGRRHEAIALLYRGAISRTIELARVEIVESDTEGDCLRRVGKAGIIAHPGYFKNLTASWVRLAYASTFPVDDEVRQLCQQWPYAERRSA
jgi:hypothetical protein